MNATQPSVEVVAGASAGLGLALMTVTRAYRDAAADLTQDIPHGPRGYQTLAAAVRGEQDSQLAIAKLLGIDRTVMTYLIDDLVEAGLVDRRPNPADRRQRQIVPTPRGQRIHAELRQREQEIDDTLLQALDPAERELFHALLLRLSASVEHTLPVCGADDPAPNC